jgi:peptide/nickel transport system substrate-binding protein
MASESTDRVRTDLEDGDRRAPTDTAVGRGRRVAGPGRRRRTALGLVAFTLFAAACTGASTPEDQGGDVDGGAGGETGGTTEVSNPGVLIHALGGEPEGLDPARLDEGGRGSRAIIQSYEFLVDIPPDGADLIPGLATEVPSQENGLVSEDGLVYTFPLREGVVFHDGTPMTADDVLFSWDRVLTMDLPESQAFKLDDAIADMRVVDDLTFEVTLNEPSALFLSTVVYSTPGAIVSQDAVEDNGGVVAGEPSEFMDTNMVGTGPYRLVNWERGARLEFEAFADYWNGAPPLDATWEVVTDNSVGVLGMQAGDYDIIEPNPQFVEEMQNNPDICFDESGFLLEPLHLAFNLNISVADLPDSDTIPADFFWDKRVRQAFNWAFDYDAYINGVLAGFGAVPTYLPPAVLGSDPDAPKYQQDLATAEELFRASGWWDRGFTASVLAEQNNPTMIGVAQILKDSLETLNENFRINIVIVPEARYDEEHGTVPFRYAMWVKNAEPFSDPHQFMDFYYHPDGEWGETLGFRNGYEDPDTIAGMIEEAGSSTDLAEREALYHEILPLLHDDPMWIWAADEQNVQIFQCWVEGFVYNPLWVMPRWQFYTKG